MLDVSGSNPPNPFSRSIQAFLTSRNHFHFPTPTPAETAADLVNSVATSSDRPMRSGSSGTLFSPPSPPLQLHTTPTLPFSTPSTRTHQPSLTYAQDPILAATSRPTESYTGRHCRDSARSGAMCTISSRPGATGTVCLIRVRGTLLLVSLVAVAESTFSVSAYSQLRF